MRWIISKGVLCVLSGTRYPVANVYFPTIINCYITLKDVLEGDYEYLKLMTSKIWVKFQKYRSKFSLTLAIATVLDSRNKLELVEFCYSKAYRNDSIEIFSLCNKLMSLFEEYKPGPVLTSSSTKKVNKQNASAISTDVDVGFFKVIFFF